MKKKVSEVLDELGQKLERPRKGVVKFRYIQLRNDGTRESRMAIAEDWPEIILTESGEYFEQGETDGCNVGMKLCLTKEEYNRHLEDDKRKGLIGVLQRLLIDSLIAEDVIKWNIKEDSGKYYLTVAVKVGGIT